MKKIELEIKNLIEVCEMYRQALIDVSNSDSLEHSKKNVDRCLNATRSRLEEETPYPFEEGDIYYVIEEGVITESIWDDQSEELFSPNNQYFETENEALYFIKMERAEARQASLTKAITDMLTGEEEAYENAEGLLEAIDANDQAKIRFSRIN